MHFANSGGTYPKNCNASTLEIPYHSENWTPQLQRLETWTPSIDDIHREQATMNKYFKSRGFA